jgi:hypothetical protein
VQWKLLAVEHGGTLSGAAKEDTDVPAIVARIKAALVKSFNVFVMISSPILSA